MIVEYGYDRHVRSWNVVVIDQEGNIVASDYLGTMADVKITIEDFKRQYEIIQVKKIKAY